jgi:hypothetical protein
VIDMKTELDPTYRPTGDSRQSGWAGTPRAKSVRDGVAVYVGRFGAIACPNARPTNPRA